MVKYKVFYTYFSICGIIPGIMAYSTDLRKRVLDFIDNGGSKVKSCETFQYLTRCYLQMAQRTRPTRPEKIRT